MGVCSGLFCWAQCNRQHPQKCKRETEVRGRGRPDHRAGDQGDGCEGTQAASAGFSEGRRGLSQGSQQPLGAGEDKEMNLLLAPPPKGMMDTLILPQ